MHKAGIVIGIAFVHLAGQYAVLADALFQHVGYSGKRYAERLLTPVSLFDRHPQIARRTGRLNAVEGKGARRHIFLIDHIAVLYHFHGALVCATPRTIGEKPCCELGRMLMSDASATPRMRTESNRSPANKNRRRSGWI